MEKAHGCNCCTPWFVPLLKLLNLVSTDCYCQYSLRIILQINIRNSLSYPRTLDFFTEEKSDPFEEQLKILILVLWNIM